MSERHDIAIIEQVRELGASEYILDQLEHQCGGHLVRVIAFDGPADERVLARAFQRLVARRPMLQTRIDRSGPGRPFFVRDPSLLPELTVVDRQREDDWVRVFDDELNTPMTLAGDPPVRATLLASPKAGGEVVVSVAHAMCDGRSLFAFCRDLIEEYEQLSEFGDDAPNPPPVTVPPPLEALLPQWLSGERLEDAIDDFIASALPAASEPVALLPFSPADVDGPTSSHVLTYCLSAERTAALRDSARASGTSVTGAITAAEIQALTDLSAPADDHVAVANVTVDMRPHLREPVPVENMGALQGAVFTRHVGAARLDSWELARDVTSQLKAKIDRGDELVMAVLGDRFVDQFVTVDHPVGSVMVANLGVQELSHEGVLRPRTIRGAAPLNMVKYPGVYCQGVTISGVLWLTFAYVTPVVTPAVARDFCGSVVDRLLTMAAKAS